MSYFLGDFVSVLWALVEVRLWDPRPLGPLKVWIQAPEFGQQMTWKARSLQNFGRRYFKNRLLWGICNLGCFVSGPEFGATLSQR